MRICTAFVPLFGLAVGCGGDDPVSVSDVVDLKLSLSSGDVAGNNLSDEKNVNTESGNPYGAFVDDARAEVGGDPSAIRVDEVTIELDPGASTNVDALGLVFADVAVSFEMSSGEIVLVASDELTADADAGPLALDVAFDSDALSDADYADLLGGGFKVMLSGEAAAGFAALDASADLEITFLLTALD